MRKNPQLCLNGHIDVVPARLEDYKPKIKTNKIFGRGAIDMKGAVAVMIEVMRRLKKTAPPMALILVDDEEQSVGKSTYEIIEKTKIKPLFTMVGEQTDFNIVTKQKGTINLCIVSKGKSAHGAEPQKGINAITQLMDTLKKIDTWPIFKKTAGYRPTCVISTIQGGEATNSVPCCAQAAVNIRYTQNWEAEEIKKKIEKIKNRKILIHAQFKPCMMTDAGNKYVERLKTITRKLLKKDVDIKASSTGSDAKYFSQAGLPVVVFGPIGKNYHADQEWVEIEGLKKYYSILNSFIYDKTI